MSQTQPLAAEQIQAQLDRILQSAEFQASETISRFLRYVVEETLAGRADEIKAYTVAVRAFGRNPDFDPQTDNIVRVHARRMRRALQYYYLTEGVSNPILVEIPRGGYVPLFHPNAVGVEHGEEASPAVNSPLDRGLSALPSGPTILVLPLEVLGADPEQIYRADGLTEQLAVGFSQFQSLMIIGPLSRQQLTSSPSHSPTLGEEYGAQFVLQGTLRKHEDKLRITIRLVESATSRTLWAQNYDNGASAPDLFEFEKQVAEQVAASIADDFGVITRALTPQAMGKTTDSLEAYDAVLRYHHYFAVFTDEAWLSAYHALERAVQIDRNYAVAHAMLADMVEAEYHLLGASEEKLVRARKLVDRALTLDPNCQVAHHRRAFAYLHRGQIDHFVSKALNVVRNNPNTASFLADIGLFLTMVGEWQQGLPLVRKAMYLNPRYPRWYHYALYVHYYRQLLYQDALTEALQFNTPGLFWDPLFLAAVLGQLGRTQEAAAALANMRSRLPNTEIGLPELMQRTVITDENMEMLLDGLGKAGLVLPQ